MHTKRRPWRPQLTRAEMGRGWVFFALYLTVFPLSMGWVQRAFHGELPVAEANVVYYLLAATLVFLVFWTFLRHGFDLLLDWLPENLFAFGTGLVGAGVLHLLVMLIPLPVQNPNPESYAQQFALSPAATVVILVVLMPLVEEPLFRGLLFGATRRYSRVLGYVLSTPVVPEFLTGREFLKFFVEINQAKLRDPKPLDEYFELMKIAPEDRDKLLKDYSHGMKNKMQMLVNFIANPTILLLDEPLTSFDVVVADEMKQLLRHIKNDHIIIFSTHIMELALDLCDDIVILNDGILEEIEKENLDNTAFKDKIIAALRGDDDA